ncbi:MAG TPA: hypothetical protein DCL63_06335, partial [Firmicutes bacterium]|nr:hypothetical protein [Bacillota bacterium]
MDRRDEKRPGTEQGVPQWANMAAVQRRIAPELTERIVLRHNILRHVSDSQPIGRRALSQRIGQTERAVRREE